MADNQAALLALSDKVGNLTGSVEGLHRLIETALIPRMDDEREERISMEKRIRKTEDAIAEHKGHRASTAKWSAAVSALVTLLFDGVLAWFGHPAH